MIPIKRSGAVLLTLLVACAPRATREHAASTQGWYDPSRDLGRLFHDVQMSGLFSDSKTFVDAVPRAAPAEIRLKYDGRNLVQIVQRYFDLPEEPGDEYRADTSQPMVAHIRSLWPVLTRAPPTTERRSSLIPLPRPYVVPGGRFREIYYWDSYFTMLGLVASDRTDLVRDMLDNFAYLIDTFGHIPNGNRSYYLSRSQPPYFGAMVGLYATATDTSLALRYLPALETEHAFWMDGWERLQPGEAYRRVARLPDGSLLNRYWDDRDDPRPESYREDYTTAQRLPSSARAAFYRNVRATAESGWDFSSRWMRDPKDLTTLETTALVPVDLNSLLYHTERTIAALRRRAALRAAAYDSAQRFFFDVRWRTGERVTDRPTLAAAAPLYFGVATPEQARAVLERLGREFLAEGGFVTTRIPTGQQWDAPNGWAPLQWLTIEGARRNGRLGLADSAAARWLALNERVYKATGRMLEKYDVVDLSRRAGGGEYPTQDGFGWTNGVALALCQKMAPACER